MSPWSEIQPGKLKGAVVDTGRLVSFVNSTILRGQQCGEFVGGLATLLDKQGRREKEEEAPSVSAFSFRK